MKKILNIPLFILLLSSFNTLYAQYINIGSTKQEVKKVQDEPTSIEVYEEFGEEIWRYGEEGIATVTFKNGKIKGFRNYDGILKIGDISQNKSSTRSEDKLKSLFSEPESQEDIHKPEAPNTYGEDKSGLYGSASQSIKTFPKKYEEMAEANGLSPYEMPDDITLQQMQKEYERKKYLKWGLIALGAIGILYLLFRMIIKKKHA
ncbi:hypothetical protein QX233_06005 [Chryseobacterium gambrini]|uniref:Uncharacterized protein n=1 Tax=Chryseobacterium gambrini TaxID=373672 RepID=A0AAJ1R2D9_9FLAO|nr:MULTISPECIES: hypothetical protein [Chryseobacterium]MDN4012002.1 hypothetical protein [Chryseobacterium gambrini]QWA36952.1 hypothetical protein KKI44_13510 [Chryseobacterium sp. ZHDP1]